jgi:hypothetical protein
MTYQERIADLISNVSYANELRAALTVRGARVSCHASDDAARLRRDDLADDFLEALYAVDPRPAPQWEDAYLA